MDDANKILAEMRALQVDLVEVERMEKLAEDRREALVARRQLLEETWTALWSRDDMTLIQAKMIAHQEIENRRKKNYWYWTTQLDKDTLGRRTRVLRWIYARLGGK